MIRPWERLLLAFGLGCVLFGACAETQSTALETLDKADQVAAVAFEAVGLACTQSQKVAAISEPTAAEAETTVLAIRSKCEAVYGAFLRAAEAHDLAVELLKADGTLDKAAAAVNDASSKLGEAIALGEALRKELAL